jgi:tetratricopeptide (TPR) repeat protein/O-antigen ligase
MTNLFYSVLFQPYLESLNYTMPQKISSVFDYSFIVVTCFVIFITIYGLFNLYLPFLVIFFIYLAKIIFFDDFNSSTFHYTWIDLAILLVAVAEGVSYITSTYRENSFYSIVDSSFFIFFYYWVKFNLKHDYQRKAIFLFATVFGIYLFLDGMLTFLSGYSQMKSAGLNDFNEFRHLLSFGSPNGSPTADWSTIFLACLPFSLILFFLNFRKDKRESLLLLIPAMLILMIPVISCFRGMYFAIAAFAIIGSALFLLYKLSSFRKILLFNTVFMLSIGLIVVISPFFKPVLTTISMFQTTSQVRSFEGRKSLWKIGVEMVKDHPLTGIGSNNFPTKYIVYKDQNDDAPYAGRVFNTFLQITIEKGFTGLCAYSFLIITFFFISHRKIKLLYNDWNQQTAVVLFTSAVTAILIRDLSYSSIFYNRGANLLIWFMFAHNTQLPNNTNIIISNYSRRKKGLLLFPILIGLMLFLPIALNSIQKGKGESQFLTFIKQLNHRELVDAQQSIESAINLCPENAYYWACRGLLSERMIHHKFNVEEYLDNKSLLTESDKEQVGKGIASYGKALNLNPTDDEFYHNLGWLYILNRDEKQAEHCFHRAIQIDNNIALYHISLGIVKERNGDKDSALIEYGNAIRRLPSILDSQYYFDFMKRMPCDANKLIDSNIEYLEKDFHLSYDPTVAAKLAKLYFFKNEKEKALHLLEWTTKTLPSLSRPWLYLGDLYQSVNEEKMISCYQKSTFLDNSDVFPLLRLAQHYEQKNQINDAIQFYRRLIRASNLQYAFHSSRVSVMYSLACKDERMFIRDYLVPQGMLSYCAPLFDISSVYLRLADIYTKKGDTKRAEEYLRQSREFLQ